VSEVVPLLHARETTVFGSKAVGLGDATRAGLPVPPGIALSGPIVEAVASGDAKAVSEVTAAAAALSCPLAVRSSAVDEDGADASFAGQHLTLLNVPDLDALPTALREVWWSANSDAAISYRQRVGLFTRPSVGVVVQSLLNPDAAGVMFTVNPITGAEECMIEAAWGLGESVVAGLVIPDTYRVARSGEVLERTAGRKSIAVRSTPDGGTVEEPVPAELVDRLCLDDEQLAQLGDLGVLCEQEYGRARDIEWAFADGTLYLLQCRAITTLGADGSAGDSPDADPSIGVPPETLKLVPLFEDLTDAELAPIARLFKHRRFPSGEIIVREGTGGASFFLIEAGNAEVTVNGEHRATLGAGDYFGEIALLDEGTRSATVQAAEDLSCWGLTLWEFRPLVQANGEIGWKLLQSLAKKLRSAEQR
jgi:pyruvate,water dikinase